MGKGKASSTYSQSGSNTGPSGNKMTFEDFFEKYLSPDAEGGRSEYTDVPLDRIQEFRDNGLNPQTTFQLWLEDADDYGKPNVVDDAEFDKLVNGGAQQIFRGMPDSKRSSGQSKLEQIMYGDKYYSGMGVYGDGLYFADNINVAGTYAANAPNATGAVVKAVLKPGFKSITYGQAHDMVRKKYPKRFMSDGDISAWARSQGYDVIIVDHPRNGRYYNVINREAIIMSKTIGKAKSGRYDGGTIQF